MAKTYVLYGAAPLCPGVVVRPLVEQVAELLVCGDGGVGPDGRDVVQADYGQDCLASQHRFRVELWVGCSLDGDMDGSLFVHG